MALDDVLNVALNIVNIKSLVCSGVHVDPFCDKNNDPSVGCLAILCDVVPKTNS